VAGFRLLLLIEGHQLLFGVVWEEVTLVGHSDFL
jgi:hypothetical protein